VRDSLSCLPWLPRTLAVDHRPTPAAEFPNDNPDLHQGARWVCLRTRGASRAVWRWAGEGVAVAMPEPLPALSPSAWPPAPFPPAPPDVLPLASLKLEPDPSLPFVMDIDPSRIVLCQRVADVPPPPAFVFRAFRPSRPPVSVDPERPVSVARQLDVSSTESALRQVRRGSRVDVAPCLPVEGEATLAVPTLTLVAADAKRADPDRPRSRRSLPVRRGLISSPVPEADELHQAIRELESAFGERVAVAAR
jgi:hypothetical protein